MTAQINDTCFHHKINFAIAGISGSGIFDPATLGFEPDGMCSACWRGYITHYSILNDSLFLTSLEVVGFPEDLASQAEAGTGPELFGVLPTSGHFLGYGYEGFQLPIAFTGGLLLAHGFIRQLYVHMGFHPVWKYERVREVIFDAGRVTADYDRSSEMAEAREKITVDMDSPNAAGAEPAPRDVLDWIGKCFLRDY